MGNYIQLFVWMYANDKILLAESQEDSHDALCAMFNHYHTWNLQVNVKKTEIELYF